MNDKQTYLGREVPQFRRWKGQLGWEFTAQEELHEWVAKVGAAEYMAKFGKAHGVQPYKLRSDRYAPPKEMQTKDAAAYLGIGQDTLRQALLFGYLHRYRKPESPQGYWYKTEELDAFRCKLRRLRADVYGINKADEPK